MRVREKRNIVMLDRIKDVKGQFSVVFALTMLKITTVNAARELKDPRLCFWTSVVWDMLYIAFFLLIVRHVGLRSYVPLIIAMIGVAGLVSSVIQLMSGECRDPFHASISKFIAF